MKKNSGIGHYIKDPSEVFESLKNKTIIFFDTETTGLKHNTHQITELAAVAVKGPDFKIVGEFDEKIALTEKTLKQIEDEKDKTSDPKFFGVEKALKFNKYHDNKKKAKDEMEVLQDFKKFVSKYGKPILIAHNAKFDMAFVGSRLGKLPKEQVYDTMQFSKFFFIPAVVALSEHEEEEKERRKRLNKPKPSKKDEEYLSSTLEKLIEAFKIDKGSLHTALVDVKGTAKVFKEMMSYFEKYNKVHKDPKYREELGKRLKKELEYRMNPRKRKYLKKQKKAEIVEKVKIKLKSS